MSSFFPFFLCRPPVQSMAAFRDTRLQGNPFPTLTTVRRRGCRSWPAVLAARAAAPGQDRRTHQHPPPTDRRRRPLAGAADTLRAIPSIPVPTKECREFETTRDTTRKVDRKTNIRWRCVMSDMTTRINPAEIGICFALSE